MQYLGYRDQKISTVLESLNLYSILGPDSLLSSQRILSENECKVRYLQGLKAGLDILPTKFA